MNQNRQTTKEENSHNRYDKAYKTLLRNPEVFCQFMRSLVKEELAQTCSQTSYRRSTRALSAATTSKLIPTLFIKWR